MLNRLLAAVQTIAAIFATRADLVIENLALRQQLAVLQQKHVRPRIRVADRVFWLALRRWWPRWKDTLAIVQPATVLRWHREGFRRYWRWKSRRRGRHSTITEIRALVRRMAAENPTWGAPRIHGEIRMLGLDVSERTVSRLMPRRRNVDPNARQSWRTFLRNHREGIAAIDFFTVPTVTFRVLYGFFVIHHARRTLVHFGVTEHPTVAWITQQLREAFPYDDAPRYLILDRDGKYGHEVPAAIRRMGIRLKQTAARCPWQDGVAERFVGTARRDLFDHVIFFNEKHLQRLIVERVRLGTGLSAANPVSRWVRPSPSLSRIRSTVIPAPIFTAARGTRNARIQLWRGARFPRLCPQPLELAAHFSAECGEVTKEGLVRQGQGSTDGRSTGRSRPGRRPGERVVAGAS